mgnify:CR=1 FL=1
MNQQELEEAVKAIQRQMTYLKGDSNEKPLKILLNLAKLYLQVIKSGIPKKLTVKELKKVGGNSLSDAEYEFGEICYNQCHEDFTVYLTQKLEGLGNLIMNIDNPFLHPAKRKELSKAIRKYLGGENV